MVVGGSVSGVLVVNDVMPSWQSRRHRRYDVSGDGLKIRYTLKYG